MVQKRGLNIKKGKIMKIQVMTITPQMAVDMLKKNTENRKLRESTIETYATDMRNGDWVLTHQGIAFDNDGKLIDGQHRLYAIIRANVPVETLVTTGSQGHMNIDTQIKRTPTDILGIEKNKVAIVKMWKEGTVRFLSGRKSMLSIAEIKGWYDIHKEAIDFAVESTHTHKLYLRMNAIKAAVATAYYHVDHEKLKRFCEVLISGEAVNELDKDPLKLREWVIFNKDAKSSSNRLVYLRVQQVIKKYMEGVVIQSVSFKGPKVNDPLYYLPEDEEKLENV